MTSGHARSHSPPAPPRKDLISPLPVRRLGCGDVLWGTLSRDGSIFEFEPSVTGRGRTLPGRFRPAEAVLDLAEARFEFRPAGQVVSRLGERSRGWRGRSTRFLIPMGTGELLIRDDALLIVHGSVRQMEAAAAPGTSARLKGALVSPTVRTFLLVRRSDVRGWRQKGRSLELFCLATSETLLVPTRKVVLRIRGPGSSGLRAFLSSVPEAQDLGALDARVDLRLPTVPVMSFLYLVPLLVALVGLFGSLGIAIALLPPGSPGSGVAIGMGMALLVGGLGAFFIASARMARKAKRAGPNLHRVLEQRSLEQFERDSGRLAREFVEAGRSRNIPLDSSVESLVRVPALEAQLTHAWLPTTYRYAAYLGEVFARDVGSRMHAEWVRFDGGIALRCREVGIDLDVLGYAQARLAGRDAPAPLAKLREWRWVTTLAQSAQPLDLFAALGIQRDQIRRSPDALSEIVAMARRGDSRTVERPFGSFRVVRGAVQPGLWIQFQTLVREEAGERVEEARCLRPVFEADRLQECVILETFELPCGGEALVVADYGGTPGQPLVLTALATDYLAQASGSLGPGQRRTVALGGIALSGEALAPTPGGPTADPASYGSIHPANPSQPLDPRVRIIGIVETVRAMRAESQNMRAVVLDVNARGLHIPIIADPSFIRGALKPGCGLNAEVWLEIQFEVSAKPKRDVDVA